MLSLHKHNWLDYKIENIVGGKSADGVSLLELFLKDYAKEFNITTLNASCKKCLNTYLQNYKSKMMIMDSNCKYILHKKREGIQLEFGSNIFVNNNNITEEYANKLISKFKTVLGDKFSMDYLFSKYPKEEPKKEVKNIEVVSEEVKEQPVKKTRKPRKKTK